MANRTEFTVRPIKEFLDSIVGDREDGCLSEKTKAVQIKLLHDVKRHKEEEQEILEVYEPLSEKDMDLYRAASSLILTLISPNIHAAAGHVLKENPVLSKRNFDLYIRIMGRMFLHILVDNVRLREEREHLAPPLPDGVSAIQIGHLADGIIKLDL